jgi:hypothetical protein
MQSSASSRSTVSFQSDKLVYYASVFVYDHPQKSNFINYKASLHAFESKYQKENKFIFVLSIAADIKQI